MTTATDHWLVNTLMSPAPMPTPFDWPPGASQSQPPQFHRLADALVRVGAGGTATSQQLDNEALAAQHALEAFTRRTQQSVRPDGGRREGVLTDLFVEQTVPQSPMDYAALLLSTRFRPFVKAGALGLGMFLEPSAAEAGVGSKILRSAGGLVDRVVDRIRYPKVGDPIERIDRDTGKIYWSRELTPEAKEFAKERALAIRDMRRNGFEPFFDPDKRLHVDSSFYPTSIDTGDIVPKRKATFDKYMDIVGSPEARERLRRAYERGLSIPNAKDMLALGQFEQLFIQNYGPEIGRRAFRDWVTSVAATTAGASPTSNLLMAGYANYARVRGLPYTDGAHTVPYPVAGRFLSSNMKMHDDIFEGRRALDARTPKRHDLAQGMLGHPVGVIDEQITSGMMPGETVPRPGTYGVFQRVLQQEAKRENVLPSQFSDLARAGFINLKHPDHGIIQPTISDLNEVIERVHRLSGASQDDVARALLRHIPYFGMGGLGIVPALVPQSHASAPGG